MAAKSKKAEHVDLEKVAGQLASIRIIPIAGEGQISLRATAKFTTKSFIAGDYTVSVGLKYALLNLQHPSFELENAYTATLPKEVWSESSKQSNASAVSGSVEGSLGGKLLGAIGLQVKAKAEKDRRTSAEQQAHAPYRIINTTPSGWQIGTELGDPRAPAGALPEGLEHCLSGDYLSGKHEEKGDGHKDKFGEFALCVLKAKPGGNDPRIGATLFGAAGSLKLAIKPTEPAAAALDLHARNEEKKKEEELRRAFIEICLHRAEAAQKDGAGTDALVSGEFYLSHHEVHSPKTGPTTSPIAQNKAAGDKDE